jgi:choline dehydrogenase-like flavoprotein
VNTHYDVIIIGSGAGGGTMARALAGSGARILVLERGTAVPQEADNWNPEAVWKHLRYRTTERWLDGQGEEFLPYTHYGVGGNTKFWGSVLYRLRREDFQAVEHMDGVSPAWRSTTPSALYERSERLYRARAARPDRAHGIVPYAAMPPAWPS